MAATFTVFAIGTGSQSTGDVDVYLPTVDVNANAITAADLVGKLMVVHISCNSTLASITKPSTVELLLQGYGSNDALFFRKCTGTETTQTFSFGSNVNRHGGYMTIYDCGPGYQWSNSIVDLLADNDVDGHSAGTAGKQHYLGLTITEEDNMGLQYASRNVNTGNVNPATTVVVTSGWTAAGIAISNATNSGIVMSAQMKNSSPTIAGDISANTENITGNSVDNLSYRNITLTLRAQVATGLAFDASFREEVPRTAFPLDLFSGWSFEAGDTFDAISIDPATATYTLHDGGVVDIDDFDGYPQVSILFNLLKSSSGTTYDWSVVYPAPEAVRTFVSASGTLLFTGSAAASTKQFRTASGTIQFSGQAFATLEGGRDIPFSSVLNDAYVLPVVFAALEYDSGTLYLHNDLGTITTLGHDWSGVGSFGSIDAMEEREDGSPTGTILRLSGIDPTLLENALTETYQGRPVTIYLGMRDIVDGDLVSDPMELFAGQMDQMSVTYGLASAMIEMRVESEMYDFSRALLRYFSDAELQKAYPGDLAFQYMAKMVNNRVTIGNKTLHTFGTFSGNTTS